MTTSWVGSSKNVRVYDQDESKLLIEFSDRVSVFDRGAILCDFPGLGALRCAIAVRMFEELESVGFRTHYLNRAEDTKIVTEAFNIPEKGIVFAGAKGRLLPLEILFRNVVTKKFFDRIARGEVDVAAIESLLSGQSSLVPGARLSPPFIECSTKHLAADTYVSDVEAAKLANISCEQLQNMYLLAIRPLAACLRNFFREAGFELCDGKIEGALTYGGSFVPVDAFSPDELRLVREGRSFDKDPIRKWYEVHQADWVWRLLVAKAEYPNDKSKWPEYEAVPPREIIQEFIESYRIVARDIRAI